MKQILLAFFISLALSNCAPTHTTLPSWESQNFNSTQKKVPAISIKQSPISHDQNRSIDNRVDSGFEDVHSEHGATLESFNRNQKRLRNLPQSRYAESLRNEKYNTNRPTDQQSSYQISNRYKR